MFTNPSEKTITITTPAGPVTYRISRRGGIKWQQHSANTWAALEEGRKEEWHFAALREARRLGLIP